MGLSDEIGPTLKNKMALSTYTHMKKNIKGGEISCII